MTISLSGLAGLVLFGVIAWVVDTYVPMIDVVKKIFRIVVVIVALLWLLAIFGAMATTPIRLR